MTHLKHDSTGVKLIDILFNFKKTYLKEHDHVIEMNYKVAIPVLFKIITFPLLNILVCII
jgi:hypothetical protein